MALHKHAGMEQTLSCFRGSFCWCACWCFWYSSVFRFTVLYSADAGPASHRVRLWRGGPASKVLLLPLRFPQVRLRYLSTRRMLDCDRLSKVSVRIWYRLHKPFPHVVLLYFEWHPNPLRKGFGSSCPSFYLVDMMVAATSTAIKLTVMIELAGESCAFFCSTLSNIIPRYVTPRLCGRCHEFFVVQLL